MGGGKRHDPPPKPRATAGGRRQAKTKANLTAQGFSKKSRDHVAKA
jgi:hypothetical protein